ncbi:hypothetical protein NDU88_001603 [Pleurodeles waltl]|uniref:Uncharacterized protein n=1 Tax=Pleurodeles waltl TaxID=8319 RepID=A0AAV7VWY8_PLEWA|nr:hypothetical protein NDU88_001603 [Pleurodeles waltl]
MPYDGIGRRAKIQLMEICVGSEAPERGSTLMLLALRFVLGTNQDLKSGTHYVGARLKTQLITMRKRALQLGNQAGIQDGGRISRLIATTALAHLQITRGSHSPAKAVDAADAVRLQHGPLQALHGFLAAPLGSGPRRQAPEGPARRCQRGARPRPALLLLSTKRDPRRLLATLAGLWGAWDALMVPKLNRTPRSLRARQNQDPGGTRKDKKLLVSRLKEHSNPQVKGGLHKTTDMEKDTRYSVPTMFTSVMRLKQRSTEKAVCDSQSNVPGVNDEQVPVASTFLEVLTPICDAGGREPPSRETDSASPGKSGEMVVPPQWGVRNYLSRNPKIQIRGLRNLIQRNVKHNPVR